MLEIWAKIPILITDNHEVDVMKHPLRAAALCVGLILPISATAQGLDNSNWQVDVVNGKSVPEDRGAEMSFGADGQFGATAGCNRFIGQVTLKEDQILFPAKMASTLMACPPPLDAEETAFAETLHRVVRYEIAEDMLRFRDQSGNVVMELSARVRTP